MDHGLGIERRVQQDLLRLARDLGLPLVATNDLHYTRAEDAQAHAVLLCVQSGSTLADPKRFKFDADEFYLKSPAEMRQLWRELPEACDNTLLIAERCEVAFTEGEGQYMPRFPLPRGRERGVLVRQGGRARACTAATRSGIPDEVRKQADYELEVITSKGYAGYFLVVADFINWAKEHGIRVGPGPWLGRRARCAPTRCGITDLDPLQHGLIFERFLNPERMSMPDFDVDFDERRRGEVIRYVTEKYGDDRVAQIVTYGTIKAKQALKDAGRVLGYPFSLGERMTKAMPPAVMGKDIPLSGIFDPEHPRYKEAEEFRQLHASDPDVAKVVETARGLENLKRQWGVHAAGVIMSSEPLVDLVPIMRREQDGADHHAVRLPDLRVARAGQDGLPGAAQPHDPRRRARQRRGQRRRRHRPRRALEGPDRPGDLRAARPRRHPRGVPVRRRPDALAAAADAPGQLRGHLGRRRPLPAGPDGRQLAHELRAAQEQAAGGHATSTPSSREALEPILGTTYGLIVYQEQVMAIAQKLAGYTLGKADLLRRAMGKKKREVLDAEYVGFEKGMLERGFSPASIKTLWDVLVPFSDYAFNKAHSAAYGLVSYWTAYLKANYPAEYMAALLTSVRDDKDKSALYLNECRRLGIKVLPPDVNSSDANFTPVGTDIRFGLTAIRNVGANVVEAIVATRTDEGPVRLLRGLPAQGPGRRLQQADHRVADQGRARSTTSATPGAAWSRCTRPRSTPWSATSARRPSARTPCSAASTTAGPTLSVVPPVPEGEWDKQTLLSSEREMLGLYVSDHPLFGVEHILARGVRHARSRRSRPTTAGPTAPPSRSPG